MKKLLLFGVVLGFCSSVMAAGYVELRIAPEDVNLDGYQASDTITIQIYATDFYTAYPNDTIGFMDIVAVLTDSNGTASAPSLHSALAVGTGGIASPGDVINAGGVLIEDIRGCIIVGDLNGVYPFPAVLWECEFHIPDAPLSSIITISLDESELTELTTIGYQTIVPAYTVGEPLEIQMACCPGDTDNNGKIDLSDFYRVMNDLSYANYLRTGGIGEPNYLIYDGCATTGFLWDNCLDIIDDEKIDLSDFYKVMNDLSYANYLRTGGEGEPNYLIYQSCVTTGMLWPCN